MQDVCRSKKAIQKKPIEFLLEISLGSTRVLQRTPLGGVPGPTRELRRTSAALALAKSRLAGRCGRLASLHSILGGRSLVKARPRQTENSPGVAARGIPAVPLPLARTRWAGPKLLWLGRDPRGTGDQLAGRLPCSSWFSRPRIRNNWHHRASRVQVSQINMICLTRFGRTA